ncbi:MAG: hypothetical protein FVQ82_03040 [Planctomycetes bacterium]|nr:hypothetical protein [Planctomycetota bacterium]
MKNLTLSILVLGACFAVFTNVQAQAGMIYMDFNRLEKGDNEAKIGRYMTNMMGSKVTIDDAEVRDNWDGDWPYWEGKNGGDDYLRCNVESGDIEIIFKKPIIRVKGDGYAFDTRNGYDYYVKGYDASYGNSHENPKGSSFVQQLGILTGDGHEAPFDITFSRPVTLLVLSNSGKDWVGIDNLYVEAVPVPGAGLLGMIGIGVTGWLKRRKAL